MKRVEKILFSNGSEADFWLSTNCRTCWKGTLYRSDGWTSSKCCICRDIMIQWFDGDHKPYDKTVEAVKKAQCPFFAETRPKAKTHRPTPGQLQINFENDTRRI